MNQPIPRSVLDDLDRIYFAFDRELCTWNRTLIEVTGYSETAVSAMAPDDLVVDQDTGRLRETVATAAERGEATVDVRLDATDGDRPVYELAIAHATADATAEFVGIGREIDEDERSDRGRRPIVDRMTDAFFALDEDWEFTYVNDQAEPVLEAATASEYSAENLIGVDIWEAIPDVVGTTFHDRYREAMATQEAVSFEEYYEPLDTWFEVNAYPSESGLSVYFRDITERHRHREELEHREAVLREIHDVVSSREMSFAEKTETLLALGRDELDTEYGTLSEIHEDDYVFEVVDAADDSIEEGDVVPLSATNCEITASTEETLVLGDVADDAPEETDRAGYTEWGIECYIGAPVVVDGDVYGTFCFYGTEPREDGFSGWHETLVDLMSRWAGYELQHRQANERLQRQNDRLERFVSIVSHDLRNPLNVAQSRLELEREKRDSDHLAAVAGAQDRIEELIEDLLSLSRVEDEIEATEAVSLGAIARDCWDTVETGEASLRIADDERIQADPSRLQQLFENLVRNAIEHGPADGGSDVTITVGSLDDGFYVEDDGTGIDPDDRDQVFDHGYSESPDGTGFGLAIVREVTHAHGWQVHVEEGTDGGARFEFTGVVVDDDG